MTTSPPTPPNDAPPNDALSNDAPPPDPRPVLDAAVGQAAARIAELGPDDLARPTPCPEFDVATLVGHLIAVHRRLAHVATGGRASDVPSLVDDIPPAELGRVFTAERAALATVLADDAVLDRTFLVPWGEAPGRAALFAYVQEYAVHAWDLAAATGTTAALDPAAAETALALAVQFLPAEPRGGPIPFGPAVDVPADAGTYERLVGWLGRDPAAWR